MAIEDALWLVELKNDVIDAGIYSENVFKKERETMETDKNLTLTSETNNRSNSTNHFVNYLTLGDDW